MEKKRKGPVKVTAGAPAPAAKPKKKRYYPSKPKAKIEANKIEANKIEASKVTITEKAQDIEPFSWGESAPETPKQKTWIQRVLEWLPRIERK